MFLFSFVKRSENFNQKKRRKKKEEKNTIKKRKRIKCFCNAFSFVMWEEFQFWG